jgi:hypothetical protein
LILGIPPASAASEATTTPVVTPAPESTAPEVRPAVPWPVLVDRRLRVTTDDGNTTEGVFLGLDGGAARRPSMSLFPFRLQRGGGLGVAGRF